MTPAQNTPAPPDWSTIDAQFLCPICEYDLRGLTESRCPECGHRFDWNELLNAGSTTHPYLFEHHPEAPLRSFRRTFLASQIPWRFWQSVRPRHPVRMNRLIAYAGFMTLLGLMATLPMIALTTIDVVQVNRSGRATFLKFATASAASTQPARYIRQYGSPQAAVDALAPMLTWPEAMFQTLHLDLGRRATYAVMLHREAVAILVWPLLTILSIVIFRVSLRQAGIRWGHAARCVIYSGDVAAIGCGIIMGCYLIGRSTGWQTWRPWMIYTNYLGIHILPCFLLAVVIARLILAERLYLRIRHGTAMMVASQIMVGLVYVKLSLMAEGY